MVTGGPGGDLGNIMVSVFGASRDSSCAAPRAEGRAGPPCGEGGPQAPSPPLARQLAAAGWPDTHAGLVAWDI